MSEKIIVKRSCNGCGRKLRPATEMELHNAVDGQPLPDVRNECPNCSKESTPRNTLGTRAPMVEGERTKWVEVATELLAELGEWSEPVRVKVVADENDRLEMIFQRVGEEHSRDGDTTA